MTELDQLANDWVESIIGNEKQLLTYYDMIDCYKAAFRKGKGMAARFIENMPLDSLISTTAIRNLGEYEIDENTGGCGAV